MKGRTSDKSGKPFHEEAEILPWTSCTRDDLIWRAARDLRRGRCANPREPGRRTVSHRRTFSLRGRRLTMMKRFRYCGTQHKMHISIPLRDNEPVHSELAVSAEESEA